MCRSDSRFISGSKKIYTLRNFIAIRRATYLLKSASYNKGVIFLPIIHHNLPFPASATCRPLRGISTSNPYLLSTKGVRYGLQSPLPNWPVRLGDVGYISRGRFCFMFNTTVGANDSQNINKRGVPAGHIPFSYLTHNVLTETLERNDFCGAGIQSAAGNRTVSVPTQDVGSDVTASGSTYKCTASSGALLLVNGRARSELLSCDKAIRDYIFQHFSSWVDFARNTLGIDIEARDILFIHGFTKSAQWGTVAFYDANPGNSRLIIAGGGFAAGSNDEQ